MNIFIAVFLIRLIVCNCDTKSTVLNINGKTNYFRNVSCLSFSKKVKGSPKCMPQSDHCGRKVIDGLFTDSEIQSLHDIASKGMSQRPVLGGPTILDINTGYIRDTAGLENLFQKENDIYSSADFSNYAAIISRLKSVVESTFGIEELFFTAPTFITRLDGRSEWKPAGIHDEYWHPHTDMNNTLHYQYSGLLYMSDYGKDFTAGRLIFLSSDDEVTEEEIVEPASGRVAIFTSGQENVHYVERLTSGQRFVLAFWFTCDPAKAFPIYLDGKAHVAFSHKIRLNAKRKSTASTSSSAGGAGSQKKRTPTEDL